MQISIRPVQLNYPPSRFHFPEDGKLNIAMDDGIRSKSNIIENKLINNKKVFINC